MRSHHAKCRKCDLEISFVSTLTGKAMPVDGWVNEVYYDQELHTAHFSTCQYADHFRKQNKARPQAQAKRIAGKTFMVIEDGGGPGQRLAPKAPAADKPPVKFGEQPDRIKELLARPRQPMPAGILLLVDQAVVLARRLAARGYTRERLQALSKEHAGVSDSSNLKYCGDVPIKRLITKLEELLK